MTTQEALDGIVAHFSQPEARLGMTTVQEDREYPGDTLTSCQYRTPQGHRCAVGCLIPDELYHAEFEGNSARMFADILSYTSDYGISMSTTAINKAKKIGELFAGVETQFMLDAQEEHDSAKSILEFLTHLRVVASKHGLRWPA